MNVHAVPSASNGGGQHIVRAKKRRRRLDPVRVAYTRAQVELADLETLIAQAMLPDIRAALIRDPFTYPPKCHWLDLRIADRSLGTWTIAELQALVEAQWAERLCADDEEEAAEATATA